ncbi:tRNA glutamyl-Q(34) synthetase GluQRS [Methylosinus sp. LW3]|uniref:tRNA glutamyl-Q(34) synthetase GluQRS n=1 Tax=Methylosinus sp. LW3 TaxID=107635 RepID=UPI000466059C|nr:tRNA glutamyl-Q(34) synthetase GluQRS [Methylosinus sp. LW3]
MSEDVRKIFRFAPSPNGYLHLGHAYSALLDFDLAQREGGRFLLRLEDIDQGRARPELEAAIYEDLAWLGLSWEEPVRRQSEHLDDYAAALAKLDALGLLYPCVCSRADIARAALADPPRDLDGAPLYPGTCRGKKLARAGANLRLDMAKAAALVGGEVSWREHGKEIVAAPQEWGDVVLARKDIGTSYHIAVTIDDALQGVTDVVRGRDLYEATRIHRLLQELLGLPAPAYRHHALVLDEDCRKLAKSRLSKPLRELRAEGATPADVRAMLDLP